MISEFYKEIHHPYRFLKIHSKVKIMKKHQSIKLSESEMLHITGGQSLLKILSMNWENSDFKDVCNGACRRQSCPLGCQSGCVPGCVNSSSKNGIL